MTQILKCQNHFSLFCCFHDPFQSLYPALVAGGRICLIGDMYYQHRNTGIGTSVNAANQIIDISIALNSVHP